MCAIAQSANWVRTIGGIYKQAPPYILVCPYILNTKLRFARGRCVFVKVGQNLAYYQFPCWVNLVCQVCLILWCGQVVKGKTWVSNGCWINLVKPGGFVWFSDSLKVSKVKAGKWRQHITGCIGHLPAANKPGFVSQVLFVKGGKGDKWWGHNIGDKQLAADLQPLARMQQAGCS